MFFLSNNDRIRSTPVQSEYVTWFGDCVEPSLSLSCSKVLFMVIKS